MSKLVVLFLSFAALAGCSVQQTAPFAIGGSALQGKVHGGQQPVSGATIQLYAAGSSGYGSASTALISANVLTDNNGSFSISNDYTCPSSSAEVYIVATGGNPGLGSGGSNPNLAMMAALGPCGNLNSSTFISINELTTVGSIWPLSGFMSGIANVGTSATNTVGLTNAFSMVNNLVNSGTGVIASPANATIPTQKLNLLADILAACVNTAGGTAGQSNACGKLFTATTVNGVAPTDTITAALQIAQHPTAQVAALTMIPGASAPFQPVISSTTDLALTITYSGGDISSPSALATDANGNVWVANKGDSSVSEFSASGQQLMNTTGSSTISHPSALAADTISGGIWIANASNGAVVKLNSSGTVQQSYSTGSASQTGVALDANGNAWVSGSGGLFQISPTGTVNTFAGSGTATAVAVNPR